MGLDMYLLKVKKNARTDKPRKSVTVAYWRKFNALHNFMCDKKGEEINCDFFELTIPIVDELIDRLELITKAKDWERTAESFFPTCSGFFFGSTDYDNDYLDKVKKTKTTFKRVRNAMLKDDCKYNYYYGADW